MRAVVVRAVAVHRRRLRFPAVTAVVLALAVTAPAPAATGAASSTWTLVDLHDRRCAHLGGGGSPGSYAVEIKGSWSSPITIGMDDLPPGVTATPLQSPINPGTGDGTQELAYVRVGVSRRKAQVGTYTMTLWASDRDTRQHVPVTLVLGTTRCTAY
ncbi:MAG: hypothetical protein HYZ59_02695 [Actinobacteria bacterium]|nr:hypothetical protein [Actinomycetota bacterium]